MLRRRRHEIHPERNPVLRLARKVLPVARDYHGERFSIGRAGKWLATPLVLVLLVVETTDIVFAIDSIPAILAVTTSAFIVFAANAFAILGLRSLYFCVATVMWRFVYLSIGLSLVLVYVGAKLVLSEVVGEVPIGVSLLVIVTVIAASIVASILADRFHGTSGQEVAERGPSSIEPTRGHTIRLPDGRPEVEPRVDNERPPAEHRRLVSVRGRDDETS